MKFFVRIVLIGTVLLFSKGVFAQYLPNSYQGMFDEIVENFKVIRGATSLNEGKNSLRLLSDDKIIIRMDHKKSIKTLTFVIKKDEEGGTYWMADNQLTTDMVNKYEKDLTEVVEEMLKLSRQQAKL